MEVPRLPKIFVGLLILFLPLHLSAAYGTIQDGLSYLHLSQLTEGNWATTSTSTNGNLPTSSRALEALKLLENPISANQTQAALYLAAQNSEVSDHLARLIVSLNTTGTDTSAFRNALLAQQNPDGGWGGTQGYASNHLDTALVLLALRATESSDLTVQGKANAYLLKGQNQNGGWGFVRGDLSFPFYSGLVLQALAASQGQFPVQPAQGNAVAYLRGRQNGDGGFGAGPSTAFETAVVLLGLLDASPVPTQAEANGVAYLTSLQLTNGSWADDPYSTALALLVLQRNVLANLPDLVIETLASTNFFPLRGATVTLTSDICNRGHSLIQNAVSRFFRGHPLQGGTLLGGDQVIPSLAVNTCSRISVPFDTAGLQGSQSIFVYVDPDGAIAESNEQDNLGVTVIQIQDAIANVPPSITSSPVLTAQVDVSYVYNVFAVDFDGDPLTYSLPTVPPGMTIDPVTGRIQWRPRESDLGDQAVIVRVVDPEGAQDTQSFTVNVSVPNFPPVITSTPVSTAPANQAYVYPVTASDPEGDPFSFFLLESPTGMTINRTTGIVRWTPLPSQEGVHNVLIQALDNQKSDGRQAYAVTVPGVVQGSDLVVVQVNNQTVRTDTQALTISNTIDVTVGNAGDADVTGTFTLLVFSDTDHDGSFTSGTDAVLGQTQVHGLGAGQTSSRAVSVSGTVDFRDDLIYAFVDSGAEVTEADEDNNLRHSGQASEFHPKAGPFTPALKWSWEGSPVAPTFKDVMMTPLVVNLTDDNSDGQINEDDTPDVVFVTFDRNGSSKVGILRAISGADGAPLWDVTDPALRVVGECPIAAGDLDGDGVVEIVAGSAAAFSSSLPQTHLHRLLYFEHDGTFKRASISLNPSPAESCGTPSIVDMDNDNSPEIIIGKTVYKADGNLKFNGSQCYTGTAWKGSFRTAPSSTTADLDLDGNPELITGPVAYRSDGSIFFQIDPRVYGIITGFECTNGGIPAIGNFDADPNPEIVVASDHRLTLLEHTGAVIWTNDYGQNTSGAPPTIADFNGDGEPEIGVASEGFYTVVDKNGTILWSKQIRDSSSGFTGSSVFDFEGDGSAEVVYSDEDYLYIYRGRDGKLLFQVPNPSLTVIESPVIADVDNDGRAEIIVGQNNADNIGSRTGTSKTGIFVYGDQLDQWVGTRRIWNQHAYYVTNVNEDGTIPRQEIPNPQVLNSFRQNEQLPKEGPGSPFAVPDLTASLIQPDIGTCPASVMLTGRIGNGGGDVVPVGVPVNFYDGDPDAGGVLIGKSLTSQALYPGQFEDVPVLFANPPLGRHLLTVVADDTDGPVLVQSANLARLDGATITTSTHFRWPERAIDGNGESFAESPAPGSSEETSASLTVGFPFPVNISGFALDGGGPGGTTGVMTFSNGNSFPSSSTSAADGKAPPFPVQENVTWLRVNFSRSSPWTLTSKLIVREMLIEGSYVDPEGREGLITEGREDNNRAILSTSLCGGDPGGNLPPQIVSAPVTTATHDMLYEYPVIATDLDGDPLAYTLTQSPAGMTIDAGTGLIHWVPQAFQRGDFPVTVEVNDGQGGVTPQSYTLTANPANLPPVFTSTPVIAIDVEQSYQYDVDATDPEGTGLSFSLPKGPSGMGIAAETGLIQWRPFLKDLGNHTVTVEVRDTGGATATQTFMVTVSSAITGPDLLVSTVDNLSTVTDTQTLDLSGTVEVTFGNVGSEDITSSIDILLFADRNGTGAFEGDPDVVLGTVSYGGGVPAGAFITMPFDVAGVVEFRDDLIYAWVDSSQVVAEAEEANNVRHSGMFSQYRPPPGVFAPVREATMAFPKFELQTAPLVANLNDDNGDGLINEEDIPDVLVFNHTGSTARMRVFNGATGAKLWEVANPVAGKSFDFFRGPPAIGDLDGDGKPEIVLTERDVLSEITGSTRASVYNHNGTPKFMTAHWPTPISQYTPAHIANVDGQGNPEIILGNVILNSNGSLRCQGTSSQGFRTTTADMDLDGTLEVIVGTTVYRADCSIYWRNTSIPNGHSVSVGNLDNDPFPEIVVSGQDQITVLDHDGTLLAGPVSTGAGVGTHPVIADFDGDGQAEIATGGSRLTVYEADLSIRWSQSNCCQYSGLSAFDFDGDGAAELLYNSVFYTTGSRTWFYILRGSDGGLLYRRLTNTGNIDPDYMNKNYPVVADVDNDGSAEVVVVDSDGLVVLGDRLDNWVGTRRVWNQFTYHITNVNEDVSIPVQEVPNVSVHNNFLQNPSLTFTPDVTLSNIRVNQNSCPTSVEVTARVGNGGGLPMPAGIPIALYDGQPSQGGKLVGRASTTINLAPGAFEDLTFSFAAPGSGLHSLVVVGDVDPPHVDDASLVLYWPLDGTGEDLSGRGNHGVLKGTPQVVRGVVGNALRFNSTDDYVIKSNFSDFPTTALTVEFWVKYDDTTRQESFFSYAATNSDNNAFLIYNARNNQELNVIRSSANVQTSVMTQDSGWRHISVTWSSETGAISVRRDLRSVFTGTLAPGTSITPGGALVLAQEQDSVGGGFQDTQRFIGDMDEVRVYNRVLSFSELSRDYYYSASKINEGREDNNAATVAIELCEGANALPLFTSSPITGALIGMPYTYPAQADDPDGNTLNFNLVLGPPGMSVDSNTGLVHWIPVNSQFGSHAVSLQVSDGLGGLDVQSYSVNAVYPPGEVPPNPVDDDGDGFPTDQDCDDTNASVHPGALEIPGNGIDEDCNPATTDAPPPGTLACVVGSPQNSYGANQNVLFSAVLQNLSTTNTFVTPQVQFIVQDGVGTSVFADTRVAPSVPAGATVNALSTFNTGIHPPGPYQVHAAVLYGGGEAAACNTNITLTSTLDSGTSFSGTIAAAPGEFLEGAGTTLNYSVTNVGNVDLPVLDLTIDVVHAETGASLFSFTDQTSLAKQETYNAQTPFTSDPQGAGKFVAVLARTATPTQVLAGANLNVLKVNDPPVADAGPDQAVEVGTFVMLDGSQSSDLDADPLTYSWRFESVPTRSARTDADIQDSTSASPSFTVDASGEFVLELLVNDGEASTTDAVTIQGLNRNPVAQPGGPYEANEGETIALDGTGSSDPDDDLLTFEWTVNQQVFATAVVEFSQSDDFSDTATLTVSDGQGGSATQSTAVTFHNVAPSVEAWADHLANEGGIINLSPATFIDPGSLDTHTATIDWGDGSQVENGNVLAPNASGLAPLTVTLEGIQVIPANGSLGTGAGSFALSADQSKLLFQINVDESSLSGPITGVAIHHAAAGVNGPLAHTLPFVGGVASGTWTDSDPEPLTSALVTELLADNLYVNVITAGFPDGEIRGQILSQPTVRLGAVDGSHAFMEEGSYPVEVCVTDDDGGTQCDGFIAIVSNVPPTVEAGQDQSISEGETVNLAPVTFTDPGTLDTHTAIIDWGDGASEPGTVTQRAGSGTVAGSHPYTDDGSYTVAVCVTDDDGDQGCDTFMVTVANSLPLVEAGPNQLTAEGATVFLAPATFTDAGLQDTHSATVNWGDGSVTEIGGLTQGAGSGTVSGNHTYADNGLFTVTVCVTDDESGQGCDSLVVTVDNIVPAVDAGPDQTLDEGITLTLAPATFTDSGAGDTHSATIDWGDGSFLVAGGVDQVFGTVSGSHIYDEGVFTLTVCVTDDDGGTGCDSLTVTALHVNDAPIPDAGPDQSVTLGEGVILDGSLSVDPDNGPGALSFGWTFLSLPGGSALTDGAISNNTQAVANFIPDVLGSYVLQLAVSDGDATSIDEALILVDNRIPVADAGSNQNVETGTLVHLDGSASFDPDGDMLSYAWMFQTLPAGSGLTQADLNDSNMPAPSFTPDVDGHYVVELIVDDGRVQSIPDTVMIEAVLPNVPPNADAGGNLTGLVGQGVTLNGANSQDPDNGPLPLTYLWMFVQLPVGSQITDLDIQNATQSVASFVPDVEGSYVLQLDVSDGKANDVDQSTVTASNPNVPPMANAGHDQIVSLGNEVVLDGTGSEDPDMQPGPLSFAWQFVSVPVLSSLTDANLVGADTPAPTFLPDVEGEYVIRLQVSDGETFDADNVMITVGPPEIQLSGQVTPVPDMALEGEVITLNYEVMNDGLLPISLLDIVLEVREETNGTVVASFSEVVSLGQGQTHQGSHLIGGGLPIGEYLVILRGGVSPTISTLATAMLHVTGPADSDGDGVPDTIDACPNSDFSPIVIIDGCDTGVLNHVLSNGCTISDEIAQCAVGANNHGAFVSCVAHLTNDLKKKGIITGQEKGRIQSCAAQADIP